MLVICAPMAGGPSTVDLAAAVCEAGGVGFIAAALLTPDQLAAQVAELRSRTGARFGVNVFAPRDEVLDQAALDAYLEAIAPEARELGVQLGDASYDDDSFDAKVDLLVELAVPVVSFTFACPERSVVERLQRAGSEAWATVASVQEATLAVASGCDALVAQGLEAGGHRGSFAEDGGAGAVPTLDLVRGIAAHVDVPVFAAGGIATSDDVDAAREAGAAGVQAGTAFLLCDEAGTHPVHRAAVASDAPTAYTRAFSGRTARGVENEFMRAHRDAPIAYPHIHHATSPMRSAAKAAGDGERVSCWAGTRHHLAHAVPAAEVVRALAG